MTDAATWAPLHAEQAAMADTWKGRTDGQWAGTSWCDGWSVHVTAGRILAAAGQTISNFSEEFIRAGFRFNVFADRVARGHAEVAPADLVRRLCARTTSTNHHPAPAVVMLGQIVVHGEDIRRPLGLAQTIDEGALTAVAANYVTTNLPIGSMRRSAASGRWLATSLGCTGMDPRSPVL